MEISSKTSKEVLQESIDQLSYIFNRDSVECKHSIFQGTCCFGMDKLMGSLCLLMHPQIQLDLGDVSDFWKYDSNNDIIYPDIPWGYIEELLPDDILENSILSEAGNIEFQTILGEILEVNIKKCSIALRSGVESITGEAHTTCDIGKGRIESFDFASIVLFDYIRRSTEYQMKPMTSELIHLLKETLKYCIVLILLKNPEYEKNWNHISNSVMKSEIDNIIKEIKNNKYDFNAHNSIFGPLYESCEILVNRYPNCFGKGKDTKRWSLILKDIYIK